MNADTIAVLSGFAGIIVTLALGFASNARLFAAVNRRIDDQNSRFDDINSRFDDVNRRFDDVNRRFDDVNSRFDDVNSRFDDVNERFDDVNERFDDVNGRLDALTGVVTDNRDNIMMIRGYFGIGIETGVPGAAARGAARQTPSGVRAGHLAADDRRHEEATA